VAGIEVSEAGVQFAQTELGLDVKQQAAEEISFDDCLFDVVVMFDVIEHLFEPTRALGSICRVLRPGGILVIITPNFNSISRSVIGVNWAV
jgi:2-polyprenyl-3-methyl-5-hydroxy-6-metoxy-1,4-benzoquinol methylase